MKAKDLIGKWAIRTKPTEEIGDRSYIDTPLFILKATDGHIICKHHWKWLNGKEPHVLECDFCDDGWIDYKKLIKLPWYLKLLSRIAHRLI